jgi:UTP-glucose-1-phosphate uridylyltransferase
MILDTAIIPCGGLGTRLHPITRWLPKEVLPVALRPLLYWALDEAADAGLLRAIVITNPRKPILETVARTYPGPLELEFVAQDHPRGLGDANDAKSRGATGRVEVRKGGDGFLRVTQVADKGKGTFDLDGHGSAMTPIGRVAFPGAILEEFEEVGRSLPAGAELDDVPVLQRLALRGELAGVLNPARFYDVGMPEGYRDAVAAFGPRV